MNQIKYLQSKQPQLTTYLSRTTVSDWYAPIRISGKHTHYYLVVILDQRVQILTSGYLYYEITTDLASICHPPANNKMNELLDFLILVLHLNIH